MGIFIEGSELHIQRPFFFQDIIGHVQVAGVPDRGEPDARIGWDARMMEMCPTLGEKQTCVYIFIYYMYIYIYMYIHDFKRHLCSDVGNPKHFHDEHGISLNFNLKVLCRLVWVLAISIYKL